MLMAVILLDSSHICISRAAALSVCRDLLCDFLISYITCGESCLASARFPNWFPRNITHTTTLTIAGFNLYVISSGRADSAPATGNFVPICFSRPFIVLYYIIYDVEFSILSVLNSSRHTMCCCALLNFVRPMKTPRIKLQLENVKLSACV
jgi:hypothetical protein